ncbi:MAG: hypothetical protein HMLKMBBP_02658 [Planctomycetes bacterium]|nr:hypothetical protein [Planctomycetota bacterium]
MNPSSGFRLAAALCAVVACLSAGPRSADAQDAPLPPPTPVPPAAEKRFTIVHTNDLHGHIETFPAVKGLADRARAANPGRTLWIDAGDCITGTPVSTLWQGGPVFELMNRMKLDLGCLGNHEYDHGWQRVHELVAIAEEPRLCANVTDPDGKPFGDGATRVVSVDGVRFGFLGLMAGDLRRLTSKKATEGCKVEEPLDAAKRLVPELRTQCDILVLVTHVGVQNDAAIAGAVPGIDLIVGGHSHTKLEPAIQVNGTWIVQAHEYGKVVGVAELGWDPAIRRVTSFSDRLLPTDGKDVPRDAAMQKAVDEWQAKAETVVGEVVGRTPEELSKKELRPLIEAMYADALGCDFGFQNTGGIRDVVRAGEIRVRDVWNVLPFDNTMIRIKVPGAKLTEYQQRRLGAKLDPARTYTIATNSYVGDHMREHLGSDGHEVEDTGLLMRDVAVNWVRQHGGFDPRGKPLAPGAAPGTSEKK